MIIDIHGHYYSSGLYPSWVPFGLSPLIKWCETQDVKALAISSLDVFSNGIHENNKVALLCSIYDKLWQFITIDPRIPNWWEKLPKSKKILGLKVHPTWSNYPLVDYLDELLEIARHNKWAILTHSGVNEPYMDIEKNIAIADRYPDVPIIFAHLGNGFTGYHDVLTQIECLANTKNDNTLIDTSSLSIHLGGLLEESIRKIGSERILFGTDLPLHFPESMLDRITESNLSHGDKENILYKNALNYIPKLKGG